MESTALTRVTEILQDKVNMGLYSLVFKWIFQQKLNEYCLAEGSDLLRTAVNHHLLDPLDEVVKFGAGKFSVNYSSKTVKRVALNRGTLKMLPNNMD